MIEINPKYVEGITQRFHIPIKIDPNINLKQKDENYSLKF